jgi:hypothetical protein
LDDRDIAIVRELGTYTYSSTLSITTYHPQRDENCDLTQLRRFSAR